MLMHLSDIIRIPIAEDYYEYVEGFILLYSLNLSTLETSRIWINHIKICNIFKVEEYLDS